jgi:multimeric flavodoxin WrbA
VPTLLVVHHTTSPSMEAMYDAVLSGATDTRIEGVDVTARAALAATAVDVLGADGYLLGTPANLGYMSGALKHFFDQIYYPCLAVTVRRPYGLWVHGNNDTTGAQRSVVTVSTSSGRRRPPIWSGAGSSAPPCRRASPSRDPTEPGGGLVSCGGFVRGG